MIHRFSTAGFSTACSALLIGTALLVLPLSQAQAAPQQNPRAATDIKMASSKLAQAEPATTESLSKVADDQPICDRARRRLWVEGEGWVVRRVSTCH